MAALHIRCCPARRFQNPAWRDPRLTFCLAVVRLLVTQNPAQGSHSAEVWDWLFVWRHHDLRYFPEPASRGRGSDFCFEPRSSEVRPCGVCKGACPCVRGPEVWALSSALLSCSLQACEQGPRGYFCCCSLHVFSGNTARATSQPPTGPSGGKEASCTTGPNLSEREFAGCLFTAVCNAPYFTEIRQAQSSIPTQGCDTSPAGAGPRHFRVSSFGANSCAMLLVFLGTVMPGLVSPFKSPIAAIASRGVSLSLFVHCLP